MKLQTIVLTGAAGGMGQEITRELINKGYRVIALDNNVSRLEVLRAKLKSTDLILLHSDLSDPTSYLKPLEKLLMASEEVAGLINLAAISQGSDVENISDNDWNKSMQVNLTAPMQLIRLTSIYMKKAGGSIVNVSSPVGFSGARKVSYSSTKAGLLGLTMTTARNLGKYGIRCNLLIPGTCITYMTNDWSEEKRARIASESFLNRLCKVSEIAKCILFLLSSDSSYMTGSIVDLTAGSMLGH